jgi:hypothetical protein
LSRLGAGWGVPPSPIPPEAQTIEVTLDWIAGEDPWQRPKILEHAQEVAGQLVERGIALRFSRGRELPRERYEPSQAQRAADFTLVGPTGPVLLDRLELLDFAVLESQRPGALQVLLSPAALAAPGAISSRAVASTAPPLTFATPVSAEGETSSALGPSTRGPVERVQIVVDWIAGQDPWSGELSGGIRPEIVAQLARRGVEIEVVRGHALPPDSYDARQSSTAEAFAVSGARGPVSLAALRWLEDAQPVARYPGQLRVLVPARPDIVATRSGPSAAASASAPPESSILDEREPERRSPTKDHELIPGVTPPMVVPTRFDLPAAALLGPLGSMHPDLWVAWPRGIDAEAGFPSGLAPSVGTSLNVLVFDVNQTGDAPESVANLVGPPTPVLESAITRVIGGRRDVQRRPDRADTSFGSVEASTGYGVPTTLIFVGGSDIADQPIEEHAIARARIDRQPVSAPAAGGPAQATSSVAEAPASGKSAAKAPDLEVLARQVYGEIKWRLALERERSGASRVFRG